MEIFNSPILYLILGVICAAGIGAYYYLSKRRKPGTANKQQPNIKTAAGKPEDKNPDKSDKPEHEDISTEGNINALVFDPAHRSWGLRCVSLIKGKNYGRQWLYLNYLVFAVCMDAKSVLQPVGVPEDMDHTPSELYEAIQTEDDVEEVFGKKEKQSDKIKIWYLVVVTVVVLFLMFAYATQ